MQTEHTVDSLPHPSFARNFCHKRAHKDTRRQPRSAKRWCASGFPCQYGEHDGFQRARLGARGIVRMLLNCNNYTPAHALVTSNKYGLGNTSRLH